MTKHIDESTPDFGVTETLTAEHQLEREALVKLCEALGIAATAAAYLDGARIMKELEDTRAEFAFVLAHGLPMTRQGLYRYQGVTELVWHPTQREAILAAMQDFLDNPENYLLN